VAGYLTARHWMDDEWTDGRDRAESTDPATGDVIGTYSEARQDEAQFAIKAALRAFKQTGWRKDCRVRATAVNEMADHFEARSEDLVAILALENGRTKPEARLEVAIVPSKLRFDAASALTDFGRAMETSPGRYTTTLRQPAGVAAIIAPWNSPIVLFIRSLVPALVAGCTTVGKLPGFTAQTKTRMCDVCSQVRSRPYGAMNVFIEAGSAGARAMTDAPEVLVISLTGSSKTCH
jgi:betaine-aldehyde dehydrogenase